MLKIFLNIVNFALHVPAIGLIYYFWQPISVWYLSRVPALGVDLYLSVTYASYQLANFSLPFNSFKDFWFAGYPLMRDYPQLAFYLMLPFVSKFGPVAGVQRFTMFALLLFIVFCYLLFYKLSKNHGVSILLSVLVLLSPNIYGAATWAGSIPYFFSQVFFPLGLLAGAFYLENPKIKYLALAAFITGAGFMINGFAIITFLIPSMFLIIVLGGVINRLPVKKIVGSFFFYNFSWVFASFIITYPQVFDLIINFGIPSLAIGGEAGSGASAASAAGSSAIADFYRGQIGLLYSRTDHTIFSVAAVGLVLFLVSAVFIREKRKLLLVILLVLIAAWTWAHPVINFSGVYNILRHDPYRAFWQFSVGVGALGAYFIGFFVRAIEQRLESKSYLIISFLLVNVAIGAAAAFYAYTIFDQKVGETIKVVEANSEYSSAFPESLSIRFKKDDLITLKKELVPSFMDPNDRNTRLYDADATVNIWWPTLFNMPLSRGYVDPPIGTKNRGGIFWLDIAIANDSLTRDFKLPEDIALNNALFLIDWNAIGFFEGGRLSSKGPSAGPSSYLIDNKVFDRDEMTTTYGAVIKFQTASGKPELAGDLPQNLHFYKVADKYASKILAPSNASSVLVFSDYPGYEDILRILASQNINSKRLVPALYTDKIDDLSLSDLKDFDAVFMYQYHYGSRDKAFKLIEDYVKGGGKVFIDTGSEVGESSADKLPEIFPFNKSVRKGYGKEWNFSSAGSTIFEGVDFSKFGPAIFNDSEWKIATSPDGSLREGANVLLKNGEQPILVERKIGSGLVVWSGMNLSYHYNQYKSDQEAQLFINILNNFTSLDEKPVTGSNAQWLSSEKVQISFDQGPRGVLFKEEGYKGWNANDVGQAKSLPIYKAGPTFPGFMYVPLRNAASGPVKVEFVYGGTGEYYFVTIVNLLAWFVLLDLFIAGGYASKKTFFLARAVLGKRVSSWWKKEDE